MSRLFVSLCSVLLVGASCEAPRSQRAAAQTSTETPAPATLDQLAWMVGFWEGDDGGTHMEELWLPRRGDVMVGLHVDLFASGRSFFEYLRIEQQGTSVVFFASPGGRSPTSFLATSVLDSSVVFENAQHDFPQKIEYNLDHNENLHARISGIVDGAEESTEWIWGRADLPRQ